MAYFKYKDKKVNYEVVGSGEPLILLHGNSVSSKMFGFIIDLYKDDFELILIDFLGHGKSDRIDVFSVDFWYDQAKQVIALCEILGYEKYNLLGSSGGALAAINVALERPELVNKVIADSFEGEKSVPDFAENVIKERATSKTDEGAVQFWRYMHGDDWSNVVDLDTDVVVKHHKELGRFFHKSISELSVPILLIGTKEDEYFSLIGEIYSAMDNKITDSRMHLFESGGHPAVITSADEFSIIAKEFLAKS